MRGDPLRSNWRIGEEEAKVVRTTVDRRRLFGEDKQQHDIMATSK